ncbi:MAG: DUF3431 domain-containing protein [Elusimicrobia bacterium]|nr:DUF3431 domain-containing protein [Elusimicrobiota bacterium]
MSAIKKTDTFFVISNFNTDPERYLSYCEDYLIYDQSTDPAMRTVLEEKYRKISFVENTGHNISDYFRFFRDRYEDLPAWMLLGKGNMIGRHVSEEFFERVYSNKRYTFLYDDRANSDQPGVAYQLYDGAFLEINNSWYVPFRTHRYFSSYNALLRFVFKDPIIPEWVMFSPGACHIVSAEQVRKYPKAFYENMRYLVSYTYFPSEAHQVERMMNLIFGANYELNPHMREEKVFQAALAEQEKLNAGLLSAEAGMGGKLRSIRGKARARYNDLLRRLMFR